MRTWLVLALLGGACKKEDPAPATPESTAPVAGQPAASAPAAEAAPAAPELPPLGAPPAEMDPKLAAACDARDAKACLAAATAFAPKGLGWKGTVEALEKRRLDTARYAQRGCDLGDADACLFASRHWPGGSPEKAAALEKGCQLNHLGACGDVGWGGGDPRRLELLEQACRADAVGSIGREHGEYCERLSSIVAGDGPRKDAAKAQELKALSCKQGYKVGCPCKSDEDCGGDAFCHEGECAEPSTD